MEQRIGLLGSDMLLSYMGILANISSYLDNTEYKNNRKPNPNAHRIKFNRCPRKIKKAIKNSFYEEEIKSFNLIKSINIKDAIIQCINNKQPTMHQVKGYFIQKNRIKSIIYNYRRNITFIH